jgi:hypothetical protein
MTAFPATPVSDGLGGKDPVDYSASMIVGSTK